MDHAQEIGLWKAVSRVERSVSQLDDEVSEIRETMVTRWALVRYLTAAFVAGLLASQCSEPLKVRSARIIEVAHVSGEVLP